MSRKIWLGLGSVFLILVLVLGIQMLKEGNSQTLEANKTEEVKANPNKEVKEEVNTSNKDDLNKLEEVDINPDISLEEDQEDIENIKSEEEKGQDGDLTLNKKEEELPPASSEPKSLTVTLSVSVKTLLDKKEIVKEEKLELIPEDGWIFPPQEVEFYQGESAFNVLLREMKKNKIHMEYVMTPIYNSNYIEGIGNIYEFDCGELSGWMYAVNDISPNLGTTNYELKDGDVVRLLYTCDLGRDLGFDFNE